MYIYLGSAKKTWFIDDFIKTLLFWKHFGGRSLLNFMQGSVSQFYKQALYTVNRGWNILYVFVCVFVISYLYKIF